MMLLKWAIARGRSWTLKVAYASDVGGWTPGRS
jgi:hypothetical protein